MSKGYAISSQPGGVDRDLVLLHHAANGRHFRNPRKRFQFVTQEPVLQAAQFTNIVLARSVDQRIDVNPADTGRIRTQLRPGHCRQCRCHLAQVLEHPAARPVEISIVTEDDIDIGVAKKREATDYLCPRHRQHGCRQRVSHLIFDDLGCLARVARLDDDLDIREVRDGINRRVAQCIDTREDQ